MSRLESSLYELPSSLKSNYAGQDALTGRLRYAAASGCQKTRGQMTDDSF